MLISMGVPCPEVYGDPVLLYPIFYNPLVEKKYILGVIPHFIDNNSDSLKIFTNHPEVLVIDILDDVNVVIENILSCSLIASSSLHGLIASDAYGIPSVWIELSSNIFGGRFKYYDYFLSVKRYDENPVIINENTTVQDILNAKREYKIDIDLVKLLEVCPFLNESSKKEFIRRLEIIENNLSVLA
jgi:pyruvyltransferase